MSNLAKRIASAAVLVPLVLLLVFFSSKPIFVSAVSLIAGLAGFEFGTITLPRRSRVFSLLLAFFSSMLCASVSLFYEFPPLLLFSAALSCISLPCFFMFSKSELDTSVRSFAFSLSGAFYCGVLLGFIGLTFYFHTASGSSWILLLLVGTFLGDTGAYAFGRLFGKHKLASRLSPGKTWAGAFGGLFSTTLSVFLIRFFFFPEMTVVLSLSLSFCLSVLCQLGDLSESFLKRGIGVKDSGHLIPGHGGLLDRIDALMFGAPVVFLFSMLQ